MFRNISIKIKVGNQNVSNGINLWSKILEVKKLNKKQKTKMFELTKKQVKQNKMF